MPGTGYMEQNKGESLMRKYLIGVQMLFVAFGALVLVPILTGLNPNVALFTAGAGTLLFHLVTKGMVPVFIASSFAYIAPIMVATKAYGLKGTLGGLAAAGVVKMLMGGLIKMKGSGFIKKFLPSHVIGPVIVVIGLNLAPVAVNMSKNTKAQPYAMLVAVFSMAVVAVVSIYGRKMLKLIPILIGIAAGYILSLILGYVNFAPVAKAAWISVPKFVFPALNWEAILYIVPVAIAPMIEHIGDMNVISNVAGKDFTKNPGLHRTLLGDGVATTMAGMLGGPPNTTYSEVTGAVALTKYTNPAVMRIAAVTAILLAFIGKVGALLKTIPAPVMGGIMVILFGAIAIVGIKNMLDNKVDLGSSRNMIIAAVILVIGIGGAVVSFGASYQLKGIGLSAIIGIILNAVLPVPKEDTTVGTEYEDL